MHMRKERDKKVVRIGQQTETVERVKALSILENRLLRQGKSMHIHRRK